MATKGTKSSGTQFNNRGVTQGTTLVGQRSGLPIDEVVDTNGIRRLAVDAAVTLDGSAIAVDLDPDQDGVYIGNANGNILIVEADGSINANTEVDASDGDNIAISAHPFPLFSEQAGSITDLLFNEVFTYTSMDSNSKIVNLQCTGSTPMHFRLKIDGVVKYEKRTSSLDRNTVFEFKEHRPLLNAEVLTVEAKVERLIQPAYSTFITMEGYLA